MAGQLSILASAVLLAAFWLISLHGIAHASGWAQIAAAYPGSGSRHGSRWSFESASFGAFRYALCLTVGASTDGLNLEMTTVGLSVLARPGHPPIFVPWNDVSATRGEGLLFDHYDLRFRLVPKHRVRMSAEAFEMLSATAGPALHVREAGWPGSA